MRSISKWERCVQGANKCAGKARAYSFCIRLARTPVDKKLCTRKYNLEIKHAYKYRELVDYYGG